jgi:hypothetical protein
MRTPTYSIGTESLEVKLVTWDEIPWNELAFPNVHWALSHFREVADRSDFAPFQTPPAAIEAMRKYGHHPHHPGTWKSPPTS